MSDHVPNFHLFKQLGQVSCMSLLFTLSSALGAIAHGVNLQYQQLPSLPADRVDESAADTTAQGPTIQVQASFDTGTPLINAQVLVYSPTDPSTPWRSGLTDEQGQFQFSPDLAQPGNWKVKIRQAGHGQILTIPISPPVPTVAEAEAESDSTVASEMIAPSPHIAGQSPIPKTLVATVVVGGLVGTAIYFTGRKQ